MSFDMLESNSNGDCVEVEGVELYGLELCVWIEQSLLVLLKPWIAALIPWKNFGACKIGQQCQKTRKSERERDFWKAEKRNSISSSS